MASNQNQGMMIGLIIFAILTVLCGAVAVVYIKQTSEMTARLEKSEAERKVNEDLANQNQQEIFQLKDILVPMKDQASQERQTVEDLKKRHDADLAKFGARLTAIDAGATRSATYTQMLEAALTTLDQRNSELQKEKDNVAATLKVQQELKATADAQVKQFETAAMTADQERIAAKKAQTDAEGRVAELQKQLSDAEVKHNETVTTLRAELTAKVQNLETEVAQLKVVVRTKEEYINKEIKTASFAATYDGQVTRVNPAARTVWINLGSYDLLKKHVTFSVQPRDVAAGSDLPPKGKIEVVEILGDHLAECRIVEDDMQNPILPSDNIYTSLWQAGQRTRFAFAGKVDLDDDGSDDMDQVRGLVAGAGGQIDAEIVEGKEAGELTIETRYLVLGTLPADKAGIDAYNAMLNKAQSLGVQRVPVSVFLDQIGYKKEPRRIQFGGGSLTGTEAVDPPDGGPRVSTGKVSDLFKPRRPSSSAY